MKLENTENKEEQAMEDRISILSCAVDNSRHFDFE